MIVAPPNLFAATCTLIVGDRAYQRHIGLDLAFHAAHAGAQIVVAGDDPGDTKAFENEWARWRKNYKHRPGAIDRICGMANTYTIGRAAGLEARIGQALLRGHRKDVLVVREFQGMSDNELGVNRWLGMCRTLVDQGVPYSFLSIYGVSTAPINASAFPAADAILRMRYGFDNPQLRGVEGLELMLDRLRPAGPSLFVKAEGNIDFRFTYADALADLKQPILA